MLRTQETEADVNLVEAFSKMGLLCDRTGRVEDAAFHYQQALALGKNSPELQQNLGRVLQEQGDLTGAISSYQQVLAVNPDDVKALYNIGVAFQLQNKIEAAIHSYQQAIHCWANSSKKVDRVPVSGTGILPVPQELNVLVGGASTSPSKELLPYAINAYSNWGCILVQDGKFDAAIQVFQAGIAVAPDDATLYNNLGIALFEQRKPEEAIALYRKAIELQPELVMARHNLGKAFQRLGLHAFAGECFEQVISKQPDYVSAYSDRAVALMAQGKRSLCKASLLRIFAIGQVY
jgi:tetratricopeptide (TPR) repeat protein